MRRICFFLLMVMVLLGALSASAQTVPSAAQSGVVEKGLEKKIAAEGVVEEKPATVLDMPAELGREPGALPTGDEKQPRFLVKSFRFSGNTIFSERYFQKLVRPYRDKELSLADLQYLCDLIMEQYRRRGYFLVRAYLPEQEVFGSEVKITIIEGKAGEIKIEGAKQYSQMFIWKNFRPSYKGVLSYYRLLKSLLVLNENPGLAVTAVLTKGTWPNTADIAVKVEDKKSLDVTLDYNNYGSRYVSRNRLGTEIQYNNCVFDGDTVKARGVMGVEKNTLALGRFEYTVPINGYGTRVSAAHQWSEFDVQREFRAFDSAGQSTVETVMINHPLIRSRVSSLDVLGDYNYKNVKNYLFGDISSEDKIGIFSFGFRGNHTDMKRMRDYAAIRWFMGDNTVEEKPTRTDSNNSFTKGLVQWAHLHNLINSIYLYMKADVQLTADAMPTAEQIAIGGAETVRGYPQSEYLGDYGYVASVELRMPPPLIADKTVCFTKKKFRDLLQFVAFFDQGEVGLVRPLAGEAKRNKIASVGGGLRVDFGHNFLLKIDVGTRLAGRKPSDGAKAAVHWYVSKTISF